MTEENLISLFENAGIICEAFDNPEAKAMLVNGILEHFPEKKLVSASGMAGYGSPAIDEKLLSLRGSGYGTDLWQRIDGAAGCDLRSS